MGVRLPRFVDSGGPMLKLICALIIFASAGSTQGRPSATPVDPSHQIFIGGRGTVLAIDRTSGQEVWRSRLKGRDFVNVVLNGGDLYAATRGELYCLDVAAGNVRWHVPLKGLGGGLVTIAGNQQTVALRARRQKQQAADAGMMMLMIAMM